MVFIRFFILLQTWLLLNATMQAQSVYYPAGASRLLQSTAEDIAVLMQRSMPSRSFTVETYTSMPATGIVLVYDSTIITSQTCRVKSNGTTRLQFAAAEDNAINYGVYEYLRQLGFRFFQPGDIWEIIPQLSSPIIPIDTTYSCRYEYKSWFVSGGCNAWVMDNNNSYYWDMYNGDNGHQLALYMRRNNMTGGSRFTGHRDDLITESYLDVLRSNPCYVAPYNGSREATWQSTPDVRQKAAMDLWSNAIEQQYTAYRSTIFNNRDLYANIYRNYSYHQRHIGIEVQDGASWANSSDGSCDVAEVTSESDQHITLANYTAAKLGRIYPNHRYQVYAYNSHADVPSAGVAINSKIDIQVVPTAFQTETSAKGLMARWYKRARNISEYHYLNLPQWSGETPSFYLDELRQTVERVKAQQGKGIVWEASPAKFVSLPFLLAANTALKNNVPVDSTISQFCSQLFGNAATTVAALLQYWSSDMTVAMGYSVVDNRYKLPMYLKLLAKAQQDSYNDPLVVKQRLNELKAYLHYMVLFYDWMGDQRPLAAKAEKAAALCTYLAKINRLQIVNSYFLINDIVYKFGTNHPIFSRFNTLNGTAYANGLLPLITNEEIERDFQRDFSALANTISQYQFLDAPAITTMFSNHELEPLEKIKLKVMYTFGKDYGARTTFDLLAPGAGSFTIKYKPQFEMPGKGYINFTVESTEENLGVLKDISINQNAGAGILYVAIPAAGNYRLSVVTKFKSSIDLEITTNGNYFYKRGPFMGNTVDNYRGDLLSMPGYFYVPRGIDKLYFSLSNSNPGGAGFAGPDEITKQFVFLDQYNQPVMPRVALNGDSALFYMEVPAGAGGTFWRAFKMEGIRLCFANISNMQWYARKKACAAASFTAGVNDQCAIVLKADQPAAVNEWRVYDAYRWYNFRNSNEVTLPASLSPSTIAAYSSNGCQQWKRLGDDPAFMRQKTACATGILTPEPGITATLYPNPGTGLYKIMQQGEPALAKEIVIFSTAGLKMAQFANTQQFNIAHLAPGCYIYQLVIDNASFKGKLVRL